MTDTTDTTPDEQDTDEPTGTVMPRDALVSALEGLFPDWLIVPAERNPDVLDRPAVVVKQRDIAPLPAAPNGAYTLTCIITIVDDHEDIELAEPALDANVLALWEGLMSLTNVHPKTATKAEWSAVALCYDIETDLTVTKG
jgi:hypothetical protein